MQNMFRRREWK